MKEPLIKLQKKDNILGKKARVIIGGKEAVSIERNKRFSNFKKEIYEFVNELIEQSKEVESFEEYEWIIHTVLCWESYLQIHFMDYHEWEIPDRNDLEKKGTYLSLDEISQIERGLKDLKRVYLICDQVEAPEGKLREAVEKRFSEGVKYTIFVSKSKSEDELFGYYKLFKAIAEIIIRKRKLKYTVDDLVSIENLTFDWDDYPYIFYVQQKPNEKYNVIGFRGRGLSKGYGISRVYEPISGNIARMFIQAIKSEKPSEVPIDLTQDHIEMDSFKSLIANIDISSKEVGEKNIN